MASPFNVFRKNQRIMLVVVGVGCMIAILLGDIVTNNRFQPGQGGGEAETVVVSWKGGELTERELDQLRQQRGTTVRYLAAIAQQAIDNGGSPKGPGVVVDQRGQISRIGIPQDTSDEAIVHTMLMAEKAEKMGFTVNDVDVKKFILQVSDESLAPNDLVDILAKVGGDNMNDTQLFESLRYELLAQKLETLGSQSGVFFSTPGEMWQYYNRINRRIEAEVVAIDVKDFTSEVPTPSTAILREFYEKHKNQVSHPSSPEPGFRLRQKLAFGYFQANLNDFMEGPDGELAKVTEQEIVDYYEENKGTSFRERELPSFDDKEPAGETELTPPANSEANPAPETPAETPADPPANPAETTPPAETPAEPAPPAETPAPEAAPGTPAPPADAPAEPAPSSAEPAPGTPPTDDASSSRNIAPGAALFVSYLLQDDQPAAGPDPAAPAAEPAAESQPAATEPAADAAPAAEPPAAEVPAAQPAPAPEAPATEPAAETADPEVKPAVETTDPAQPPANPGIAAPAAEPKEPKYTPLEKVRDEIRRSIANPRAFERMKDALAAAEKRLEPYSTLYREIDALSMFKDDKETAKQLAERRAQFDTTRPNYEAIARELGLTYGEIPLSDPFEMQNYPLGKVTIFDRNTFQQIPFAAFAFGERATIYKLKTIGDQSGRDEQFLYWATEAQEPRVPEFSEVYDETKQTGPVLDAWKLQQALPLAQAKAKELAEQSNKTEQPLAEQFKGQDEVNVTVTAPFSWLTTGGMPFGFGQLQISPVQGVETPGIEFMQTAFSLDLGEAGVAVNHPHTQVYVVHVIQQAPTSEALRTQFANSQFQNDMMQQHVISQVTFNDRSQAYQTWLEDVERELDVKWLR